MVVVRVVAFCIIITRIFVGLSQRERERERDVMRVLARPVVKCALFNALFLPSSFQ